MNELNKIKSLIDNIVIKNSIESWEACKFLDILFVVQKCEETLSKRKIYYYLEFLAKNGLLKKTPSPTKRNRYIY